MSTLESLHKLPLAPLGRRFPALATILRQGLATLALWRRRARSRRELRELDEHLLRDIGVSRGVAEHEAAKPFWRA